jgi:hypothetical protein
MRNLLMQRKPAHVVAIVALLGLTTKACVPAGGAPPGSHSQTIHSCSPNYTDENKLGRLSVQQRGPGTSIQWGAYPNLPAEKYIVGIYIGDKKVDGKKQNYAPHGSLPARAPNKRGHLVRTYKTGQIFKIAGTSYDAKGSVVQKLFIKCRLV